MFVDGAKLSMGDLHFSQGDGEITFCGAIEMGGFMDLHVDLIKGGMATYGVSENAIFMPGNVDPRYDQWLAFSGTSVTLDGEQRYLDSHLSYQRACLHAIDYLQKFGYSAIQAYMILGAAPIEGRLSGVVDIPNSCSTVYIPTAIFDFDVRPSANGPHQVDPGQGVPVSRPDPLPAPGRPSAAPATTCTREGTTWERSDCCSSAPCCSSTARCCWAGWTRESAAPMNFFVGALQLVTPTYLIFTANGDADTILSAGALYMFAFTYLYVALNLTFDLDGTGPGLLLPVRVPVRAGLRRAELLPVRRSRVRGDLAVLGVPVAAVLPAARVEARVAGPLHRARSARSRAG